jgi:hypothetical protein
MIQRLALTLGFCFALAVSLQAAVIVPTNSTWQLFKGRSEASAPPGAWRAIAFDDAAWTPSAAPFSYGETAITTGTFLNDMRNQYTSIFLRRKFVLTNLADIAALQLRAVSDDGFIAWINGREVVRYNMPAGEVPFSGLASSAPAEPVLFENYTLLNPHEYLVNGTNVLAIQGFNVSLTDSTDFVLDAELSTIPPDLVAPTITNVAPAPGTITGLTSVTVQFSEPVVGVDAGDFLINGLALSVMSGANNTYTFSFVQPPYGTVSISWLTNHGIFDQGINPNSFDSTAPGASWQYQLIDQTPPTVVDLFPAVGATTRSLTQIEVTFSEDVTGIDASDLLINGLPASNMSKVPGGPYIFQFTEPAAGTVNVNWKTAHGITDLAPAPNAFAGGAWSYQLDPSAGTADLVINEVLASNVSTNGLADEDGEQSDWIEIRNRGTTPVDLAGWSLSDDPDVPGLWVFPSRLLGAGQYLVVFASGKDRKAPTGTNRFHTNFRLGNTGEHLGLYSPDSPRALVSGFTPYPEQRNDHSYGYDPSGNLRYFRTPTPGAPNGLSSITGVVEPVHFNVERGHFTSPFDLYISTDTLGASVRMTFDGSEPTESNGLRYTNAIRVATNSFIRAAAFRTNMLPSRVETHSYLFNQSAAIRSLPIISIVTGTNNLIGRTGIIGMNPPNTCGSPFVTNNPVTDYHNPSAHGLAWERPVSAEFIGIAGQPNVQVDCGIRVQGSDYQRPRTCPTSKFSFRLYFRNDYGPGRFDYPLFTNSTVTSFDQLVLRAGFNDPDNPFIRDELTRRLSADMGQVASHGNLVNLFVNGQYRGYYNPCERVHEEMLQAHHGGGEQWDVVGPTFAASSDGFGIIDGDRVSFLNLVNYVNSQNVTNQAIYQQVMQRLDLVNFVDYCLLNVYCGMGDWPANNWRAGKDRGPGGIWRFYIWDGEWAMGIYGRTVTRDTFAESGPGPDNSGLASTGNSEIAQIYQRLRLNPEFRLLWADRIHKHYFNNGVLTDPYILAHFNSLRTEMASVLPGMATDIQNPWVAQRRGYNMTHFQLYGLLASSNAPTFNRHGGRVTRDFLLTMTASNLTDTVIYYTTNGVDPRVMFTGAVSPAAQAYNPAVELRLQQSMIVKARTLRSGTNWSALTEARFDVGTIGVPIRITEINYNPPGGNGFEFIELSNIGYVPVDLTGMFFDEGITFTFPAGTMLAPGARLVLSSALDTNGFATRYPGVVVAGQFDGNLANGGERITLRDRTGVIVVSVDYDDDNGWPTAPDGQGSSLELIDPFAGADEPANWQASTQLYGTPGLSSAAPGLPAVRINELMAENLTAVANGSTHPDWVELYNAGSSATNIGGWSLTDDGNARRFVFPAGTTIAAGGYLLVWCDATTNTTPGLHTGFALGRNGETIQLFNSATSRVDAVTYGLQVADYSFGRIGAGWQLTLPTPNAANMIATVGSAVSLAINEWLANPLPGQSDWVELHNTANAPVSLLGMYLGPTGLVQQITSYSYVPARGFAQIFLDEGVGADHLDARLAAAGGTIVLYDAAAVELTRVTYTAQQEGVSQGRLPNGTGAITTFVGSMSPGASNYTAVYNGPYINEVMARNRTAVTNVLGDVSDWIEFYNPATTNFDLGGMSLSVDSLDPGQWVFPPGTVVEPASFLVIWCEDSRPPTLNSDVYLNTGRRLDGEGGGVYLFNAAGQLINLIEYGFQIEDESIGRIGAQWRLLNDATPGAANSTAATLGGATNLVFNEWAASGPDWFELFNSGASPVDMSGLYVTDDPSLPGITKSRVAPLSFIKGGGWVQFIADEDPGAGRDHVNFSLAEDGESLRLYAGSNLLTAVYFGKQPPVGSEGRLPDGAPNIIQFPMSPSPAESNYLPPENVVINEVLSHSTDPLEDAIELYNPSSVPASIGGWYLSDSSANFKKIRLPAGLTIPAGGYNVLYEAQFNDGTLAAFSLNRSRGNDLWLSETDAGGNLTGVRAHVRFGAALNGVSMGRFQTHLGSQFVPLSQRTFGADNPSSVGEFRTGAGLPNAAPRVGPIIINEIMYHPPDVVTPTNVINNTDDEFVELHNSSGTAVDLSNWRLTNGVSYSFAPGVSLPAGGYLVVVSFSPATNGAALTAFRATYSLPTSVPIFGPYAGRLDNEGEAVELYQPDVPDGAYVPQVLLEQVDYTDRAPWPGAATDGGGLSMQRTSGFANEPVNWVAGNPTPGSANNGPIVPRPVITQSPVAQTNIVGGSASLSVTATGPGPFSWQWRFNGMNIPDATNATLLFSPVELEHEGVYDVFVSNPGGSTFSAPALMRVAAPPTIITGLPLETVAARGSNVVLAVTATGPGPLTYQWRFNGVDIDGATSRTLSLPNVQLSHAGDYEARVTNPTATVGTTTRLVVLMAPLYTLNPQSVTALVGDTVTFRVAAIGTLPMNFRWRSNNNNAFMPFGTATATLTITNVQLGHNGANFDAVITNRANPSPGALSGKAFLTVLADTDGDRAPNTWEVANGFDPNSPDDMQPDQDADGDGASNLAEYTAGTDPHDPSSYLHINSISTGSASATIQFLAVSNKNYTVQFADQPSGFAGGGWSNLAHVLLITNPPPARTVTVIDSNAPPGVQRYYRLVTPFQP